MSLGHHALLRSTVAGDPASRVHRLDPRAKVLGLLAVTLVAVSTPLSAWPVYVACALVLAGVAAVARIGPGEIARRGAVVLPLVLFVAAFTPFMRRTGPLVDLGPVSVSEAGLAIFATVTAKATLGTVSAVLLAATTPFPLVARALEALKVPRLLVLIALLTYRYAFVLGAEVGRMRLALAARNHRPRQALRAAPLGRLVAALFLRAVARGERVHLAMLARGFDGSFPAGAPLVARRADVLFVGLVAVALLPARVLAG
jgi:cobalt/nickel transport system permease protein